MQCSEAQIDDYRLEAFFSMLLLLCCCCCLLCPLFEKQRLRISEWQNNLIASTKSETKTFFYLSEIECNPDKINEISFIDDDDDHYFK